MLCTNCEELIEKTQPYYRLENKGSILCSNDCVHESYAGFYSKDYINNNIRGYQRIK